jgi:gliding motility-associated-like protein
VLNPIVDETITPVLCGEANGRIDLTVTPPTANSFIWSNGNTTEDLVDILPGQFSVTVTSQNGCTWTSGFNVPGSEIVELQLETDIIQAGDDSVTIRALVNVPIETIDIVNWFPEPLFHCNQNFCLEQTIARPLQQTEIRVMVIDTNGCMAEARLTLRVDVSPEVYIPNVFSPNNDGINDFFTIYGNKDVEQIVELRIYDRWGNFVFTKNEFPPNIENFGWDGRFRDKEMNPAVFAYGATVLMKDGSERFYKGDVTLVR